MIVVDFGGAVYSTSKLTTIMEALLAKPKRVGDLLASRQLSLAGQRRGVWVAYGTGGTGTPVEPAGCGPANCQKLSQSDGEPEISGGPAA
jgi:hypothetical protein